MSTPVVLPLHAYGPSDGRPVVCLHGFLGRGSDWEALAPRLGDVCLYALDLPGHGEAIGAPRTASVFETAAASVMATLDAAGLGRVPLVGYSMGGRLALYLSLIHI